MTRADRLRLADDLADAHDAARAEALRLAVTTAWAAVANAGRFAGGPPAAAARLFAANGADWPRLRLSVRGDDANGFQLLACVKAADDGDGWETVAVPRSLLAEAGRLLLRAA